MLRKPWLALVNTAKCLTIGSLKQISGLGKHVVNQKDTNSAESRIKSAEKQSSS
jgi:hypothetical protein